MEFTAITKVLSIWILISISIRNYSDPVVKCIHIELDTLVWFWIEIECRHIATLIHLISIAPHWCNSARPFHLSFSGFQLLQKQRIYFAAPLHLHLHRKINSFPRRPPPECTLPQFPPLMGIAIAISTRIHIFYSTNCCTVFLSLTFCHITSAFNLFCSLYYFYLYFFHLTALCSESPPPPPSPSPSPPPVVSSSILDLT